MENTRIDWKNTAITWFIGFSVAVAAGILVYDYTEERGRLVFWASSIDFRGTKDEIAIERIEIRNEGKKVINKVICYVSVEPEVVKDHNFKADPTIRYEVSVEGGIY